MKAMDMGKGRAASTHQAKAKEANPSLGTVKLAHESIKSLNWPAMTMGFKVKDKGLFDKLTVGSDVEVTFVQEGKDYVVTSVK